MNPHDDFLVEMFNDDPRLVQMFKEAERHRHWWQRVDWFKVVVWLGLAAYLWLFWYGVAKAL